MLTAEEILREFRDAGAFLEGHFILSSGYRSPAYLQCAKAFMDAKRGARLCETLAAKIVAAGLDKGVSLIVSPALGGVVAGYEMGRQLGMPAVFFERVSGVFELRRGFEVTAGQGCLLLEDVVTTGLSSRECIASATKLGANVLGAAALVDRSGGKAELGVPFVPLISLDIPHYPADQIPAQLRNIPAVKPGSRGLKS